MSALNQPVLVVEWGRTAGAAATKVRPSDVLAALTDEQRDELAERIGRVLWQADDDEQYGPTPAPFEDWDGWMIRGRAVVAAITDKENHGA